MEKIYYLAIETHNLEDPETACFVMQIPAEDVLNHIFLEHAACDKDSSSSSHTGKISFLLCNRRLVLCKAVFGMLHL